MYQEILRFPADQLTEYACRRIPESAVLDDPTVRLELHVDGYYRVLRAIPISKNEVYELRDSCLAHVLAVGEDRHVECCDPVVAEITYLPSGYTGDLHLGQIITVGESGRFLTPPTTGHHGIDVTYVHDFDFVARVPG